MSSGRGTHGTLFCAVTTARKPRPGWPNKAAQANDVSKKLIGCSPNCKQIRCGALVCVFVLTSGKTLLRTSRGQHSQQDKRKNNFERSKTTVHCCDAIISADRFWFWHLDRPCVSSARRPEGRVERSVYSTRHRRLDCVFPSHTKVVKCNTSWLQQLHRCMDPVPVPGLMLTASTTALMYASPSP